VEGLLPEEQSGALREARGVDELGKVGDHGAVSELSVLRDRLQPDALGVRDRLVDPGIRAGGDEEADVALPARGEEPGRAAGRIGAHDEGAQGEFGIVTLSVADGDLSGELADRIVEHAHVIGDRVGPSVARTQDAWRAPRR
jgi:hypothetical protein